MQKNLDYHFFLRSNASASNLGWFRENFCQTPKHDGILMFTNGSLLLVPVVAEPFQQKHPIARKPGSTMACLPVHGGSGAGCGFVERCA